MLAHHHKERASGSRDFGDARIARQAARLFGMPRDFESLVYVSQILQGECMRVASEAFRRNYPHTQGALYWQVDENWPNTCKSGMDYYGRWKAMQYMAGRFFSPVLVTGRVEGTQVTLWGVNDRLRDADARLRWRLYRLDGGLAGEGEYPVHLPANASRLIAEMDFEDTVGENADFRTYRKESWESRRQYVLWYALVQGDSVLSSNYETFAPYKILALRDPVLSTRVHRLDGRFFVDISVENVAFFVELGLNEGYARLSDNYFLLLPRETRRVRVLESEVPWEAFADRLFTRSLIDAIQ